MLFDYLRQSFYLVYANFSANSKVITSKELLQICMCFLCSIINGRTSVCRGLCCVGRLLRSSGAGDGLQRRCRTLQVVGSACFTAIVTCLSANGDDGHYPVSSKLPIIRVVGRLSCFLRRNGAERLRFDGYAAVR